MSRYTLITVALAMAAVLAAGVAQAQNYNIAKQFARDAVAGANANAKQQEQKPGEKPQAPGAKPAETPAAPKPPAASRPAAATLEPIGKLTPEQIAQRAYYAAHYQGADQRAQAKLAIVDEQGQKRLVEFTVLRRDAQDAAAAKDLTTDAQFTGEQKVYVYVKAPPELANTALLIQKHADGADAFLLCQPGDDAPKAIPAADTRKSFAGSQFTYEDIAGRNPAADTHELLPAEGDANYCVLKSTPKDPAGAEFAYCKTWIHAKTFLPAKTSYYDAQDKELRRVETQAVEKNSQSGCMFVSRCKATDALTGAFSELALAKVAYNVGLPDEAFSEASLREPPVKYLQ